MEKQELEDKLYHYRAKVIKVTDGDTVVMEVDLGYYGTTRQIHRIIQDDGFYFDTPETRKYRGVTDEHKAHGIEAKERAVELLLDQDVYIKCYKRGSFRWLAEIWLDDGRMYSEIMINEGFQKRDDYK